MAKQPRVPNMQQMLQQLQKLQEEMAAAQEQLAQPWSPDEVEASAEDRAMLSPAEREVREIAAEFRRHRRAGDQRDRARHGPHRGQHSRGRGREGRRRRGR